MKIENKVLRYSLYAIGFSISSEIVYRTFLMCKNYLQNQKNKKNQENQIKERNEIHEVLWSNSLALSCYNEHQKNEKECDNKHCYIKHINRVISIIDNAQYSIDLAMYMFTLTEISNALINAYQRKVKIRIICDESMASNSASKILFLSKQGIPTRFHTSQTMFMHHKFCVIDGLKKIENDENRTENVDKVESFLLTGSTNWTSQAFSGNWDNMIITRDEMLIKEFQNEFNRMWNEFKTK